MVLRRLYQIDQKIVQFLLEKKTMRRGEEGNLSNKNYSITQFFFSTRFGKKLLNYLTRFFDKVIFYITYIKLG